MLQDDETLANQVCIFKHFVKAHPLVGVPFFKQRCSLVKIMVQLYWCAFWCAYSEGEILCKIIQ